MTYPDLALPKNMPWHGDLFPVHSGLLLSQHQEEKANRNQCVPLLLTSNACSALYSTEKHTGMQMLAASNKRGQLRLAILHFMKSPNDNATNGAHGVTTPTDDDHYASRIARGTVTLNVGWIVFKLWPDLVE